MFEFILDRLIYGHRGEPECDYGQGDDACKKCGIRIGRGSIYTVMGPYRRWLHIER